MKYRKQNKMRAKRPLTWSAEKNSDEAGATPPFAARCVTGSVRSLPPGHAGSVTGFGRVLRKREARGDHRRSEMTKVRISLCHLVFIRGSGSSQSKHPIDHAFARKRKASRGRLHKYAKAGKSRSRENKARMYILVKRACNKGESICQF